MQDLTRRDFLRLAAAGLGTAALSACGLPTTPTPTQLRLGIPGTLAPHDTLPRGDATSANCSNPPILRNIRPQNLTGERNFKLTINGSDPIEVLNDDAGLLVDVGLLATLISNLSPEGYPIPTRIVFINAEAVIQDEKLGFAEASISDPNSKPSIRITAINEDNVAINQQIVVATHRFDGATVRNPMEIISAYQEQLYVITSPNQGITGALAHELIHASRNVIDSAEDSDSERCVTRDEASIMQTLIQINRTIVVEK